MMKNEKKRVLFNWPFPDSEKVTGADAEKLAGIREIRDRIYMKIRSWQSKR